MKHILFGLLVSLSWQTSLSQWTTNPTASGVIYYNGGSVGIGIANPVGPFQVLGGASYLQALNVGFGASTAVISTDYSSKPICFQIGGTECARLLGNGSFAVGTTDTKGYLFAVNGSAIFTSARIKANAYWPDFVFAPDYKLPSLDSLSGFIQAHHHLPDIPAADSVKVNGIDLGENNAALLKKIEELTLYVIEQNKQLEAQQARLKRLEDLLDKNNNR